MGVFGQDRLAAHPRFRVAVVSGRRLRHVQKLVPVPGVWLAGTYGIELQTPGGKRIDRLDYDRLRPDLEALKPCWANLVAGQQSFFLEDKGWALALHTRFADETKAGQVLAEAHHLAEAAMQQADDPNQFRLLGGHKFLEIGPRLAHKGLTVSYLLDDYPWPKALPLYLGDDDKDEEAFGVIQARGASRWWWRRRHGKPRPTYAWNRRTLPAAGWKRYSSIVCEGTLHFVRCTAWLQASLRRVIGHPSVMRDCRRLQALCTRTTLDAQPPKLPTPSTSFYHTLALLTQDFVPHSSKRRRLTCRSMSAILMLCHSWAGF
jgi:trehalose-phosphatase